MFLTVIILTVPTANPLNVTATWFWLALVGTVGVSVGVITLENTTGVVKIRSMVDEGSKTGIVVEAEET